ncbi:MAG: ribose 5-phosphate isomerase B [Thermaerobacter sp.]|nr:ribose 5-phosphate isomerase B [Thermaerobacter sp.]MDA8145151.1 ribose 5-phosphate isomerase B [Thermaerobacter sp.]
MKLAVGCDHGGYALKQEVLAHLSERGLEWDDFGTYSTAACDYPLIAAEVARAVVQGKYPRGILICGTGLGMSIAANKVPGIRAAVCQDGYTARMSREHNDANILCLGGRVLGGGLAREILDAWLAAEFAGGRHQRRLDQVAGLEVG